MRGGSLESGRLIRSAESRWKYWDYWSYGKYSWWAAGPCVSGTTVAGDCQVL